MRKLVILVLLAACGGGTHGGSDGAIDAATDAAALTCTTGCPPCAPSSTCITSMATGSTCVPKCQTSTDCPDGLQCAQLDFLGGTLYSGTDAQRTVCVSPAFPAECGESHHGTCSDYFGSHCIDEQRLGTAFTWVENESCGSTITTCPNGCQPDADAGVLGSHGGHCR